MNKFRRHLEAGFNREEKGREKIIEDNSQVFVRIKKQYWRKRNGGK